MLAVKGWFYVMKYCNLQQLIIIMTNEEYVKEFKILKDSLIDNLAIYHERITLLIQLTKFDINEDSVEFEAKIIKPLNKLEAEESRIYHYMLTKDTISFSTSYQFGPEDEKPLLVNKKVGRPYCPFTLWLDPELALFAKENEDDLTKQLPNLILWNQDWKVLIGKK